MPVYASFAEIYDRFTYDVDYSSFADFYEQIFAGRGLRVKTLLDLGCGTGSLTALMAGRGYDMTACDTSPEMLSLAREKCAALSSGNTPLFLCQSMTELDLYGTVNAAYSSLDAVNYLSPDELPLLFKRLHLFVEPGGLFIFDINSPEKLRALDGATFVDEDEQALCLWRADLDEAKRALSYGVDIFTRSGRHWLRSFEEHTEYLHEPGIIKTLLENNGYTDVELVTDGPQGETGRVFIIATVEK
jgi:SAM-dependent methyltransferase